jgi:hypothetical protein
MFNPVTPDAPSANDSKRNVEPKALALPIDYLAANETSDQAKDYPANDAHVLRSPQETMLTATTHCWQASSFGQSDNSA